MNEKLTVRNFGPITEAEVEFKRVTVFIGPTGGGKSTLAKLAVLIGGDGPFGISAALNLKDFSEYLNDFGLSEFDKPSSYISYKNSDTTQTITGATSNSTSITSDFHNQYKEAVELLREAEKKRRTMGPANKLYRKTLELERQAKKMIEDLEKFKTQYIQPSTPHYIPAERAFLTALEYAWPSMMTRTARNSINLPEVLLTFASQFFQAKQLLKERKISFLDSSFVHENGRDYVLTESGAKISLGVAASGLQAVVPVVVVIDHILSEDTLSRNFIIEEPELNLYPASQRGFLSYLAENCTKHDDNLIITTHSPYILSHLNLLLYAHQVATQYPDRADEVAQLVPRESWINPQEFAAYYVGEGTVRSIVNAELGLIDDNELDAISGDQADAFDNLIRLSKGFAIK